MLGLAAREGLLGLAGLLLISSRAGILDGFTGVECELETPGLGEGAGDLFNEAIMIEAADPGRARGLGLSAGKAVA